MHIEPGPGDSPTPEQIIADMKDGVLIDGRGSYSIDQQRYNGQFGGDAFWEIKNGKKTGMVTNVTYNAITTDFWANLDAAGQSECSRCRGIGRCSGPGAVPHIGCASLSCDARRPRTKQSRPVAEYRSNRWGGPDRPCSAPTSPVPGRRISCGRTAPSRA